MSEFIDLETTITDAVNDAQFDESVGTDVTQPEGENVAVEAAEPVLEASSEPSDPPEPAEPAVEAKVEPAAPQDEFEKLAGVPQVGVGGRENRIPYSRVKKITEKAVGELAEVALGRKLASGEKALDVVKSHVAKIPELEAKVTDYESRLEAVGQFEDVMANDPKRFLDMLSRVDAYKEFFDFVRDAYANKDKAVATTQAPAAATVDPANAMPEPDELLADGSKVYSIEGLRKLLDWNAQQVEGRVSSKYEGTIKQIEERYKPIEEEWQDRKRREAALPLIRKQMEDAAGWPMFKENEDEILAVLQKDKSISLEGAYNKVVFPKLIAERDTIRQQILKEMKAAPTSTSVPTRAATKPAPPTSGPRDLEDVIKEQVEGIRR